MARDKRSKVRAKGNGLENGTWAALPHAVVKSAAWKGLTANAKVLLIEMFIQYKGQNNGDLCAAPATMAEFGWKGNSTLPKARQELEQAGLIVLTRQGGKNKPNLYGVTWRNIDECGGKLEHPPTHAQLGYWKLGYNPESKLAKTKPVKIDSPLPPDGITNPDNTA
jgi:hypothetical protein